MAPARVFGGLAGRVLMAAAAKGGAATAKKAASGGAAASTTAKKKAMPSRARTNTGIQKVVPVSSELGKFLGASEVSRTHAVKRVWEYIKLQNLQVVFLSVFSRVFRSMLMFPFAIFVFFSCFYFLQFLA